VKRSKKFVSENEEEGEEQPKNKSSVSSFNSLTSSAVSISSCMVKTDRNIITQFRKLTLSSSSKGENLASSQICSVKSDGLVRVPKREEYSSYLKSYKPIDKNGFILKDVVKKPLFTIVE
jgi:hypothetical protein